MKSLDFYQKRADDLIQQDAGRNRMLAAMEQMWQAQWQLPEAVSGLGWIHKVVSTDPHDALRAGVRVLSSAEPRIKVLPVGLGGLPETNLEQVEHALGWLFHQANRRRQASVLRDIVLSALLYDQVCTQVVYLPHQIKALQAVGGGTASLRAARRAGDFVILVRNPRHVHVRASDWTTEAVLFHQVVPAADLVSFWGSQADPIKEKLAADMQGELRYATVYDYTDLETRVIWCYLHPDANLLLPAAGLDGGTSPLEIIRRPHNLAFLPWVTRIGGTSLHRDPAHQQVPLLYSVYQSGQWDTQNILETLLTSEVIAYAAAPRLKVEGISDNVEVDYGEPRRMAFVPPGHKLEIIDAPAMDTSLAHIADRVSQRIDKSTVPRILQTGDFPAGTAYATLNLATQSGLKSLAPYKELAEQALAGIFQQIIDWIALDGRPVLAYHQNRGQVGQQIILDPAKLDPSRLFIEVALSADVPADRAARIEAAATAVRELGYSRARALEFIGETDPALILAERKREDTEEGEES
ncbi:MAG: hypothetical protein JW757_01315 [Anaerolineales bacterium]|nr:hypothetical protein [Anaerolineales bacterium]